MLPDFQKDQKREPFQQSIKPEIDPERAVQLNLK